MIEIIQNSQIIIFNDAFNKIKESAHVEINLVFFSYLVKAINHDKDGARNGPAKWPQSHVI